MEGLWTVAARDNKLISPVARFVLAVFGLLAVTFFASDYTRGSIAWSVFLFLLMCVILLGIIKRAPRRNALAIVPAFTFAALYSYSTENRMSDDFPWGLSLAALTIACGVAFLLLERGARRFEKRSSDDV